MNAEKELLLALLIEKHNEPKQAVKIVKPSEPIKRKKRRTRNPHRWTELEKQIILEGQKENKSIASMALALNLRPKQVDNMLYSLNYGDKRRSQNELLR